MSIATERNFPLPPTSPSYLQVSYYVDEEHLPLIRFLGRLADEKPEPRQMPTKDHIEILKWVITHNIPLLSENEKIICLEYKDKSSEAITKTSDPNSFRVWMPKKQEDFSEMKDILVSTNGFAEISSLEEISNGEIKKIHLRISEIAYAFEINSDGKITIPGKPIVSES